MKLFEFPEKYEEIFNLDDGVEISEKLSKLDDDYNKKVAWLARKINDLDDMINEINALIARKKAAQNKRDSLKSYLSACLVKKVVLPDITVTPLKPKEVVYIVDQNCLPKQYLKEKTTSSVDKILLKEDMSKGLSIDGAQLVMGPPSVKISTTTL